MTREAVVGYGESTGDAAEIVACERQGVDRLIVDVFQQNIYIASGGDGGVYGELADRDYGCETDCVARMVELSVGEGKSV